MWRFHYYTNSKWSVLLGKKGCQTVFQLVVTSLSIWSIIHDVINQLITVSGLPHACDQRFFFFRLTLFSFSFALLFVLISPPCGDLRNIEPSYRRESVCSHLPTCACVCVFCFFNYHYFDFWCHCAGGSSCAEVCRGGLWGVTHTDVLLVFVICFFFFLGSM